MPVKLTNKMIQPIEQEISALFWFAYYQPIMDLMSDPLYNSKIYNSRSAVISALRSGKITYIDQTFTGKFTAAISKDLSKYAKYDKRSKSWVGMAPADVTAASVIANDKAKELHKRIEDLLPELSDNLDDSIEKMKYTLDPLARAIDGQIGNSLDHIGVKPEFTTEQLDKIKEEYTTNQNLTIKGYNQEQITRLRETLERSVLNGYRKKDFISMLMNEYEVSKNKARFWARQESSLFMSKMTETRYTSAGLPIYQWSTSHDTRVRGNPSGLYPPSTSLKTNHYMMNNKYCKWNDPTVYSDDGKTWKSRASIKGPEKHPGQDWNCRCVANPVLTIL